MWLRHSQSLVNLRQRPSQARVRSMIQRLGRTTKLFGLIRPRADLNQHSRQGSLDCALALRPLIPQPPSAKSRVRNGKAPNKVAMSRAAPSQSWTSAACQAGGPPSGACQKPYLRVHDVHAMFATPNAPIERMPANKTGRQQNRFPPGVSGNPAGRPKGARNKTTMAAQALLDGEGEELTRKAIEMARAGDTVALRLCLDRILPPRRERLVYIDLPDMAGAHDVAPILAAIIKAVAAGELTPSEGKALSEMVAAYTSVRAAVDAGPENSRQVEIEIAAAGFDRKLADRVRAALAMQNAAGNMGEVEENLGPKDRDNTA